MDNEYDNRRVVVKGRRLKSTTSKQVGTSRVISQSSGVIEEYRFKAEAIF